MRKSLPQPLRSTAKHWRIGSLSLLGGSSGRPGRNFVGGMLCQRVAAAASPGK